MYVVKRHNTVYDICYIDREHRDRQPIDRSTNARTYTHTCICVLHDSQLLVHSLSSFIYRYLHSRTISVWVFIFHHVCVCIFCIYNRLAFRTPETETFQVVVPLLSLFLIFFVLDLFKSSWAIAYVTKEGVGRSFINCKHLATDSNVHILFEVLWFSHVNDEYAQLRFLNVMCN